MHELSIAQSMVDLIQQSLPADTLGPVRSVKLRIGDLAGIVSDSLIFGFEVASQGTRAEGAALQIERVPVVCRCRHCGSDFGVGRYVFICPKCGNADVEVIAGNELNIVELEIDD